MVTVVNFHFRVSEFPRFSVLYVHCVIVKRGR